MRQLLWMVEGRNRAQWPHTANLLAMMANCHRDPKKSRKYKPGDFNPFQKNGRGGTVSVPLMDVRHLKKFFRDQINASEG